MPIFKTSSNRAFVTTSPEGAFLDPRWTAGFLEDVHRLGGKLALETVVSEGHPGMFIRTSPGRSAARSAPRPPR